jgi:hypothetical protein
MGSFILPPAHVVNFLKKQKKTRQEQSVPLQIPLQIPDEPTEKLPPKTPEEKRGVVIITL